MKLRYRIILTIFLITLFLGISPLVLLYASGYRYDFYTHSFIKTGLLSLKSDPKGAHIFVNGKLMTHKTTPAKLLNLLPGEYEISIQKDGYHTWSKRLPIYSQLVTFAEEINLYKKDIQEVPLTSTYIHDVSFFHSHAIVIDKKEDQFFISLLSLNTSDQRIIDVLDHLPLYKMAPHFNSIAYTNDKDIVLKNIQANQTLRLSEIFKTSTPFSLNQIAWDKQDAKIVYVNFQGIVYKVDISTKKSQPIDELVADQFIVQDDLLIYLTQTNTNSYLTTINYKQDQNPPVTLAKLPKTTTYSFLQYHNGLISLLDQDNNLLFLIDMTNQEIKPILESMFDVKQASWNKDYSSLIYFNDFEIWTWDTNTDQTNLINRFSSPLIDVLLLPNKDIIFAFEQDIFVIEPDKRDYQNMIRLQSFDEIFDVTTNEDGNILYVFGKKDQLQGIFSLEIQ